MADDDAPTPALTPAPPAGLSPEAIEGRLMAHRTALGLMLAQMSRNGSAAGLIETLESLSVVQDHQEDPGAGTGGPEVIQGALAQEIAAVMLAASPGRCTIGEAG